jgi:hypothetical protein
LEFLNAGIDAGRDVPLDVAHSALQNVDALFRGDGVSLPFTVILDYLYGIAAYKAWRSRSNDGFSRMEAYRDEHYARCSAPPDGIDDTDVPSGPSRSRKRHTPRGTSGLEETMDELNMFFYAYLWNHARNGSRARAERNRAGGASRSKVMEWRNHLDV